MKIQLKPFKIYVEKYHLEDGNIYPPRILNLKRVGIILAIIIGIVVALTSCNYPERQPQFKTKRITVLESNTTSFVRIPSSLDSVYRNNDTVWVNMITHQIDDCDSFTMMSVIKP